LAAPTYIPIKYGIGNHTGPLGTQKMGAYRSVEFEVLYPRRAARQPIRMEPRPFYYDEVGVFQYKVTCTRCDIPQKREAFSPDKRKRNGLQSWCRECRREVAQMNRMVA
jgi:hypothetical protein